MLLLLAPSTTGDGGLEEMGSMGLSHNKGAVGFSAGRGVARSQRLPSPGTNSAALSSSGRELCSGCWEARCTLG